MIIWGRQRQTAAVTTTAAVIDSNCHDNQSAAAESEISEAAPTIGLITMV